MPRGMPGLWSRPAEPFAAERRRCACAAGEAPLPGSEMLRRKPTRLELKLDDIEEFEGARKELEVGVGCEEKLHEGCLERTHSAHA